MSNNLLEASTRIAFAAYLHDLGKFAQRAQIAEADALVDSEGNSRKELHMQEYCPNYAGRYTHVHAAYTAIALDAIEQHLPDIKRQNCYPFNGWQSPAGEDECDSLINAAARHHKPETFLQWIIATADRLASGFERSEFEQYNKAEEGTERQANHLRARMEVLLEKVTLSETQKTSSIMRYPLKALSPAAIMPSEQRSIEPQSDKAAVEEYADLWNEFISCLSGESNFAIPKAHRSDFALWFDHFDSLWLTFTHCIPSATAAKVDGRFLPIPADVSLYDHSRTTAALATALWRWHEANQCTDRDAAKALADGKDSQKQKFLLIQGDMAGIQDFIFTQGGSTSKFAAKLLRGRSAMVSMLTDIAGVKILEDLQLPTTSQILNAAGKFLIVAPNTPEVVNQLEQSKRDVDAWFMQHSYGRASLSLAWLPTAADDFRHGNKQNSPFHNLMERLFSLLEVQKKQRLALCTDVAPSVLSDYLKSFKSDLGACQLDGYAPAQLEYHGVRLSQLARDQITIGDALTTKQMRHGRGFQGERLLVTRKPLNTRQAQQLLKTDFFGFSLTFVGDTFEDGQFANLIGEGQLVRAWDLSLPVSADTPVFNGYARRFINGFVPLRNEQARYEPQKYRGSLNFEEWTSGTIKPFDVLAHEDRHVKNVYEQDIEKREYTGISALHTLKGDIDNLGMIFQAGMERPTFASMATLSRQVNNFFSIYLPYLCSEQFPNTYTVFSGGDDFFLIGPWHSQIELAIEMRKAFERYVGHNPAVTFSSGLFASKPGSPISNLGRGAETALEQAKAFERTTSESTAKQALARTSQSKSALRTQLSQQKPSQGFNHVEKNAVCCFNQVVSWDDFTELTHEAKFLGALRQGECDGIRLPKGISTGFIYGLLELANMAAQEQTKPQAALWRSYLTYRVQRLAERITFSGRDLDENREQQKIFAETLRSKLATNIARYKDNYHIALYIHLYSFRD
jgi:CRISPR-associated protein Csm1